ncbi:hypothetical protein KNU54_gp53 [Gordonia phage VanDeWege]|uniref:Uncharacterized protein n=7 Tax=Wizardvirus TaxID=2169658 RepID=A0A7D5K6S7_9CAUD|nr:hypothetical protein BH794_gp49 [Gordonia phage Wizard]YP_010100852.1 hypothetical protein KNU39_gp50 [Gordonia phage Mutzi]YP_010102110.1 hypothetical protein KNU54_gp53 [Gordonia phage VanDeWege]YP_010102397.1 hypothetical protein KNU57_gp52 [Gordonia phage Valary]YP_010103063.1 hypothetical protein KNU63_gp53 [Gordonia phage RogerDodger]YP_010109312.1 hypothetical protein KNV15_gp50 [Gordonia phage Jambalaya]WKW87177.1 hypothetical protein SAVBUCKETDAWG_50 [Gordonia phage Savbucketdawg]
MSTEATALLERVRARRAAEPDLVPSGPPSAAQARRAAGLMWPTATGNKEAGR